jgi:hypothetical protein
MVYKVSVYIKVPNEFHFVNLVQIGKFLDETKRRHAHESRIKSLEVSLSEAKVALQMEQLKLRNLKLSIEEYQPQPSVSSRKGSSSANSNNSSLLTSGNTALNNLDMQNAIDEMLLRQFKEFLVVSPSVKLNKLHTISFMSHTLEDEVLPCLKFGGNPRPYTRKLVDAIAMNTCFVESMSPAQIQALNRQHRIIQDLVDGVLAIPGQSSKSNNASTSNLSSSAPSSINNTNNHLNSIPANKSNPSSPLPAIITPTPKEIEKLLSDLSQYSSTSTQSLFPKPFSTTSMWSSLTSSAPSISLPPSMVLFGCSSCGQKVAVAHQFKVSEDVTDGWVPICKV